VYVQVYARKSLCACTSMSEWKRDYVSMFESERESVCVKAREREKERCGKRGGERETSSVCVCMCL